MSPKQEIYVRHLLKQLGFEAGDFLNKYISELEGSAIRFRYLAALSENELVETLRQKHSIEKLDFRDALELELIDNHYFPSGNYWLPYRFSIVEYLQLELRVKRGRKLDRLTPHNFISATDISAFTFCPVSYSIAKTYAMPKLESAVVGSQLHDRGNILDFVGGDKTQKSEYQSGAPNLDSLVNKSNEFFINTLKQSELIYADFKAKKSKYFKGKNGVFVGKPDYIFKDNEGKFFVVEEKFQYQGSSTGETPVFYDNHINQLSSYIYGISRPTIEYGFLIYWKYNFRDNSQINIYECHVKRVDKTESNKESIVSIFSALQRFMNEKKRSFDNVTRSPRKCANCVYNVFCGHKTGYFTNLTFPYPIGAVTRLNAVKSPQVFRVKNVGYDYNFIRLDVKKTWFSDNRKIFFFQFGSQNEFDEIILDNYDEIEDFERVYDVKFIYHKRIVEKIKQLDNKTETDDFVNDIAQMKDEMFYNELARQAFHGKDLIDTAYILRQYNDSHVIFWGIESFKKDGKVRFPFECLLPLGDVALFDFSFLTT